MASPTEIVTALPASKLATRWETSKPTILNMIEEGKIGAFKVGSMFRIPMEEIKRVEQCGTKNQNYIEKSTTPEKAQGTRQDVNHYGQLDMEWQSVG